MSLWVQPTFIYSLLLITPALFHLINNISTALLLECTLSLLFPPLHTRGYHLSISSPLCRRLLRFDAACGTAEWWKRPLKGSWTPPPAPSHSGRCSRSGTSPAEKSPGLSKKGKKVWFMYFVSQDFWFSFSHITHHPACSPNLSHSLQKLK